jgi:hypothetical protein
MVHDNFVLVLFWYSLSQTQTLGFQKRGWFCRKRGHKWKRMNTKLLVYVYWKKSTLITKFYLINIRLFADYDQAILIKKFLFLVNGLIFSFLIARLLIPMQNGFVISQQIILRLIQFLRQVQCNFPLKWPCPQKWVNLKMKSFGKM